MGLLYRFHVISNPLEGSFIKALRSIIFQKKIEGCLKVHSFACGMRTFFFLLIQVLCCTAGSAQNLLPYSWKNPLPQGHRLNCTEAFDDSVFLAIGHEGTILRSNDTGFTWHYRQEPVEYDFISLSIPDRKFAYALAWDRGVNRLYKSADKGLSWTVVLDTSETIGALRYKKVFFCDSLNGYLGGLTTSNHLLKTLDGGLTWSSVNLPSGFQDVQLIHFLNPDTGFVCGLFGGLYKTENSGLTWSQVSLGLYTNIFCMDFVNDSIGFMGSSNNKIYKTIDGGYYWLLISNPGLSQSIHSIRMLSDSIGIAASSSYLYRTTNGNTWNGVFHNANMTALAIGSSGAGIATDQYARIWKSNAFSQPYILTNPSSGSTSIRRIRYRSAGEVWAAGDDGYLLRSNDAALSWTSVSTGNSDSYNDICFPSGSIILICTSGGQVLRSTNGGNTWASSTVSSQTLRSFSFINGTTGFLCGDNGVLYKTTNAGQSWSSISTGTTYGCREIQFLNGSIGYIGLDIGQLLKTSNGGTTWSPVNISFIQNLRSIFFTHPDTGFVAGENNYIFKTSDGGATWDADTLCLQRICQIKFVNSTFGFVVGQNLNSAEYCDVLITRDAGASWTPYSLPSALSLNTIEPADTALFLIGGENRSILMSGSNPVVVSLPSEPPTHAMHVFPNPAGKMLFVECPERIVSVELYSLRGSLTRCSFESGSSYSAHVDTGPLPAGLYILRVTGERTSFTARIVRQVD